MGTRPNSFGAKEIAQGESFRDQALIAIENARLFNETQEALDQQRDSAEVLGAISKSVANTAPVFEAIIGACQRLFGSEEIGIYTIGEDDMVRVAAWRGPGAEEARRDVTPLAESVTGRVIRERRTHHIPDLGAVPNLSPTLRERVDRHGGASLLYAPMLWEDRGLGSVLVVRWPPRLFSDREQALCRASPIRRGLRSRNARLFNETQEALAQQTATADVLKVISRSAFDLQAVLDTLTSSAVELTGASNGVIALREGEGYRYRAFSTSMTPEFVQYLVDHPPVPGSGAGLAIRSGRIEQIPDVLEDPDYQLPMLTLNRTRSILAVPLLRDDRTEGAFVVTGAEPGMFPQRQIDLVQTFADQAVIVIENVRLFDEVQARTRDLTEALQMQTSTSDVLRVISRSAFDLQACSIRWFLPPSSSAEP